MAKGPIPDDLKRFIHDLLSRSTDINLDEDDSTVAGKIVDIARYSGQFSYQVSDYRSDILAIVSFYKVRYGYGDKKQAGQAQAGQSGPSGGGWGHNWKSVISKFSTTVKKLGAAAGAKWESTREAWEDAWEEIIKSWRPSSSGGGGSSSGGGSSPGSSPVGGPTGGGGPGGWSPPPQPIHPVRAGGPGWAAGGAGGAGGPGPGGPGPGGPGSGGTPHTRISGVFDPWYVSQFFAGPHGFFGKAGAAVGAYSGQFNSVFMERVGTKVGGATFGKFAGDHSVAFTQIFGTTIGNFVENMKDATVHAHAFATALKESNRRFIYYNSSIAMSYVESDIAMMLRQMRISKAIAPNIVALNRGITQLEDTREAGSIFWQNLGIAKSQAFLAPNQMMSQLTQPIYERLNDIGRLIDPQGNLGYRAGAIIFRAFLGKITYGLSELLNKFTGFLDIKDPKGVSAMGNWETFLKHPGAIPAQRGVHNQRQLAPGRRRI